MLTYVFAAELLFIVKNNTYDVRLTTFCRHTRMSTPVNFNVLPVDVKWLTVIDVCRSLNLEIRIWAGYKLVNMCFELLLLLKKRNFI